MCTSVLPGEEHGHMVDIEGTTRLMMLDSVVVVKQEDQWLAVVSDGQALIVWHCPLCGDGWGRTRQSSPPREVRTRRLLGT
jgi:hypothetical protein